jgi:glycerophosphoryl diester phosphodiesterase
VTHRPAISAHRGGCERYPAGTYEAYEAAVALGVEYVELDVRRLADATLVCHHDARAGANGPPLRSLSYPQLCALVGFEVPLVGRVMRGIAGAALGHVDLKEPGYEAEVVRAALDVMGEANFVVTTPDGASLRAIMNEFPGVRTALTLGQGMRDVPPGRLLATRAGELFPVRRVRDCGAAWVAVNKALAHRGVLRQCARHGIGAMVWTVDDQRRIDAFLRDPRVDVLVTNRPAFALRRRAALLA